MKKSSYKRRGEFSSAPSLLMLMVMSNASYSQIKFSILVCSAFLLWAYIKWAQVEPRLTKKGNKNKGQRTREKYVLAPSYFTKSSRKRQTFCISKYNTRRKQKNPLAAFEFRATWITDLRFLLNLSVSRNWENVWYLAAARTEWRTLLSSVATEVNVMLTVDEMAIEILEEIASW